MSLTDTIIGWIAPPICVGCGTEGQLLCSECIESKIIAFGERCGGCGRLSPNSKTCSACRATKLPNNIWITSNYSGAAKDLISAYKFDHQRSAAPIMASMMAEIADTGTKDYLIVPIPTATKRVRQRGFDHAVLLAEHLSRLQRHKDVNVLGRIGQKSQVGAKRSERIRQSSGEYWVRLPRMVAGRHILLVDDVMTTGATLRVAANVLRLAGAKSIDAIVFAKKV
jgi:ComF family protein